MNSLQTYSLPVSEKGQVTIPIAVRKLLDVASTNRVVAVVYGEKVMLKTQGSGIGRDLRIGKTDKKIL